MHVCPCTCTCVYVCVCVNIYIYTYILACLYCLKGPLACFLPAAHFAHAAGAPTYTPAHPPHPSDTTRDTTRRSPLAMCTASSPAATCFLTTLQPLQRPDATCILVGSRTSAAPEPHSPALAPAPVLVPIPIPIPVPMPMPMPVPVPVPMATRDVNNPAHHAAAAPAPAAFCHRCSNTRRLRPPRHHAHSKRAAAVLTAYTAFLARRRATATATAAAGPALSVHDIRRPQ